MSVSNNHSPNNNNYNRIAYRIVLLLLFLSGTIFSSFLIHNKLSLMVISSEYSSKRSVTEGLVPEDLEDLIHNKTHLIVPLHKQNPLPGNEDYIHPFNILPLDQVEPDKLINQCGYITLISKYYLNLDLRQWLVNRIPELNYVENDLLHSDYEGLYGPQFYMYINCGPVRGQILKKLYLTKLFAYIGETLATTKLAPFYYQFQDFIGPNAVNPDSGLVSFNYTDEFINKVKQIINENIENKNIHNKSLILNNINYYAPHCKPKPPPEPPKINSDNNELSIEFFNYIKSINFTFYDNCKPGAFLYGFTMLKIIHNYPQTMDVSLRDNVDSLRVHMNYYGLLEDLIHKEIKAATKLNYDTESFKPFGVVGFNVIFFDNELTPFIIQVLANLKFIKEFNYHYPVFYD